MRSATIATAIQSLSQAQASTILFVTADPTCGDTAFQVLSFLDDEAIEILKFSGSVVVKAQHDQEAVLLETFDTRFVSAFDAQPRLSAEAILFRAGTTVYRIATPATVLAPPAE